MKQQCTLLLDALRHRSMTTNQIRNELGIGHPAGRVDDLRKEGYDIFTRLVPVKTRHGYSAKVARYTLLTEPRTQQAA